MSMRFRPFAVLSSEPPRPPVPVSVSVDHEVDVALDASLQLSESYESYDKVELLRLQAQIGLHASLLKQRLQAARRQAARGICRLPAGRLNNMEDAVRKFAGAERLIQAEHAVRKVDGSHQKQRDHVARMEDDRNDARRKCIALADELARLHEQGTHASSFEVRFALAFVDVAKEILAETTFGKIGERAREVVRLRKP